MLYRLSDEIHRLVAEEPLIAASSTLKESSVDTSIALGRPSAELERTQTDLGVAHPPLPVQEMQRMSIEAAEGANDPTVPPAVNTDTSDSMKHSSSPSPPPRSLSIDEIGLHEVVRRAISEALEANAAHNIAKIVPPSMPSVNSSTDSVGAPSAVSRFNLLASRMDMLEGLLVSGLQRNEGRDREEDWDDVDGRFAALESRIEAVEFRMEELEARRGRETTVEHNGREVDLPSLVMDLTQRLSELELAVGTEHEFSLKLLDLLLNQQQASSQSLASSRGGTAGNGTVTSGSEGGGRRRGSSSSARSRA